MRWSPFLVSVVFDGKSMLAGGRVENVGDGGNAVAIGGCGRNRVLELEPQLSSDYRLPGIVGQANWDRCFVRVLTSSCRGIEELEAGGRRRDRYPRADLVGDQTGLDVVAVIVPILVVDVGGGVDLGCVWGDRHRLNADMVGE